MVSDAAEIRYWWKAEQRLSVRTGRNQALGGRAVDAHTVVPISLPSSPRATFHTHAKTCLCGKAAFENSLEVF